MSLTELLSWFYYDLLYYAPSWWVMTYLVWRFVASRYYKDARPTHADSYRA